MQFLGLNCFLLILAVEKLQYTKGNFIKGKDNNAKSGRKFSSYFITWRHFQQNEPIKENRNTNLFWYLCPQCEHSKFQEKEYVKSCSMWGSIFKSRGNANTGLSISPWRRKRKIIAHNELKKNYKLSSFLTIFTVWIYGNMYIWQSKLFTVIHRSYSLLLGKKSFRSTF